jgi:hypothetical protein
VLGLVRGEGRVVVDSERLGGGRWVVGDGLTTHYPPPTGLCPNLPSTTLPYPGLDAGRVAHFLAEQEVLALQG